MGGIAENLKVHTISFVGCDAKLLDPERCVQSDQIIQVMKRNCSLTELDLSDNPVISDQLIERLDIDLAKNKLIVENIFPLIREQEKKANEAKAKRDRMR